MPAGERSQTWYPEVVEALRREWRSNLAWHAVVELRDELQRQLEAYRAARNIRPPMMRCRDCGFEGPQAPPKISVRAMLLALSRFGIEQTEVVRRLEKDWAKHRARNGLDLCGHIPEPGPASHFHQ